MNVKTKGQTNFIVGCARVQAMCQNHDEVEVFEVSQDEWDLATQRQLDKVGLTALELKNKHADGRLSAQEFKVWMLLSSSTLLE